MIKVLFRNARKEEREIGLANERSEAFKVINDFLNERNYKSYYSRTWKHDGREYVDVGSWSEFFILEEIENDND